MAQPRTLAVFTKNRVNPAYAAARLAADRVAAEAGARTIHYVPETPDDVGQQKALVGEALANRPDAVVFVPTDDAAMVEDVRRFEAAGIPVVNCINRMEGRFVTFVGSDDVAVGFTAASALIDGLGGKGDIVVIEGSPGAPTARDRAVGLRRALDESPAIRVLGSGIGALPGAPARLAMARLLAQHPHIDGVWTANDLMAFGALDALADGRAPRQGGGHQRAARSHRAHRARHDAGQRRFQRLQHRGHRRPRRPAPSRWRAGAIADHGSGGADRPLELQRLEGAVRGAAADGVGRCRAVKDEFHASHRPSRPPPEA